MNYCPPKLIQLIIPIFKTGTPKDIILALTSIIRNPLKIVNHSSRKILIKVMETFKLDQYEKIQIFTKGKCYTNGIFGKCTRKKEFSKEDLKLFGLIFEENST